MNGQNTQAQGVAGPQGSYYDPSPQAYPPSSPSSQGNPQGSGNVVVHDYPHQAPKEKKKSKGPIICCVAAIIIVLLLGITIGVYFIVSSMNDVAGLRNVTVSPSPSMTTWVIDGDVENIVDENIDVSKLEIRIGGNAVNKEETHKLNEICTNPGIKDGSKSKLGPNDIVGFHIVVDVKEKVSITAYVLVEVLYDGGVSDDVSVDVDRYYSPV